MSEAPGTRASLLIRIRNPEDRAAWRQFVAPYALLIHGLARQRGLQDADASDLTQEVLRIGGTEKPLPRFAGLGILWSAAARRRFLFFFLGRCGGVLEKRKQAASSRRTPKNSGTSWKLFFRVPIVAVAAPEVYDSNRGSFRGWLYTVTCHHDFLQSRQLRDRGSDDSATHQLLEAQLAPTDEADRWERDYQRHLFAVAADQVRNSFETPTW